MGFADRRGTQRLGRAALLAQRLRRSWLRLEKRKNHSKRTKMDRWSSRKPGAGRVFRPALKQKQLKRGARSLAAHGNAECPPKLLRIQRRPARHSVHAQISPVAQRSPCGTIWSRLLAAHPIWR